MTHAQEAMSVMRQAVSRMEEELANAETSFRAYVARVAQPPPLPFRSHCVDRAVLGEAPDRAALPTPHRTTL
jgi:hypothetical protein